MPNINKIHICIILITIFLIFSCKKSNNSNRPPIPINFDKHQIAESAMVVTAHPLASKVGKEILEQGGNAVDAAIAVQFALTVVYPRAGNIGGGGFMIYRANDGTTDALDFRETAPAAAHRDMYLDSLGNVIENLSLYGHKSFGVPGVVDGMIKAHQKYGKIKDFAELVAPAYLLADAGFPLTKQGAEIINKYRADIQKENTKFNQFLEKTEFQEGDLFVQKDLAQTLVRIMNEGEAGFYEGKTAELIVEEMQRGGGIITDEDLKNYNAVWRKPIIEPYKDFDIISMPPPSSGGIALCQLLNIVEQYDLTDTFHSVQHIHLFTEAERRVYADRASHLGDSDFYDVPQEKMLDEDYLKSRMQDFDWTEANTSESIEAGDIAITESEETTHFSIVDQYGNAVSLTTTLNSNFGSKVVVGGAGFFLNNEMDDFSVKPGVPNQFGLVGNEANAIAPHKRMLSSMTPTIITQNDSLYMVVGTPGGSTIITSVFQVFTNVAEYNLPLKDAVHNLRFHSQWLPDKLFIEKNALDSNVIHQLKEMGHHIEERSPIGRVEAILVLPDGKLEGVADNRGEDDVEGF